MKRIWNLSNESECMYAVVYADTVEEAVKKAKKVSNSRAEWTGEEWTEEMYSGVLLFT